MVSIFISKKKYASQQSLNKRASGSGFQPSPKSPLATSDTRRDVRRNGCIKTI
ncbi:MAG: hypothetical protein OD815_001318 [Candidatus Alkanophagales archaeon MCA70_species_2]|nr:hypothetical protein [Candidatus Alkanophaga liquidiphilum]